MFSVDDPTFLCERCLRNTHYVDEEKTNTNTGDEETTASQNRPDSTTEDAPRLKKACDFKAYNYSQI